LSPVVSITGSWMQMIARAWLALDLTGSAANLGVVTATGSVQVWMVMVLSVIRPAEPSSNPRVARAKGGLSVWSCSRRP
jgi:hypothetical protein